LRKNAAFLALILVISTFIPAVLAGTPPLAEAGANKNVVEGASFILDAAGSKGSSTGKTGPFKILWYDDYEENYYPGSIREYLTNKGHTVTYFSDGSMGYLDARNYMTYDVIVVEHTCGPYTVIGLQQWFQAGKGYVVLNNSYMYADAQDAYIKTLLGVDNNGVLVGELAGTDWSPAQLYFNNPTHPIATTPNTFNIKDIVADQYRDHVAIIGGTNVVEYASGMAALVVRENVEGAGRIAYFGSNFHNPTNQDPEVKMLVENMIYYAAGSTTNADITKYEWDFTTDGVYDYSETAGDAPDGAFDGKTTWSYGDNGVYTVTLRITDATGAQATDTCIITGINSYPTITMGAGPTVEEGAETTYTGSFTDAGWLDTHTAVWSWGDGTPNDAAVIVEENVKPDATGTASGTHVYAKEGSYPQMLTLYDKDGASWVWARTVTVTNMPPVAEAGEDATGVEGTPVSFDGSATSDPGTADVLTYSWNFGDGSPASSEIAPTHTYVDNGVYTVTLTVKDDAGAVSTDTLTVTIENAVPAASATNDGPAQEGAAVTVTATQTAPGTLATFTYSFDWDNDGVYEIVDQSEASATYTWLDDGVYTVGVMIKDNDGGVGLATTTVTVEDLTPFAEFTWAPEPQSEGSPVAFTDASTSSPDEIVGWEWIIDGVVYTEQNPTHTFSDNGVYTVTLTVTDEDGSTGSMTHEVTVVNVPPTAEAGDDVTVNEGVIVTFSGAYTDPGADAQPYVWDFGDGETATGSLTPSHTYTDNGEYVVTLTVTDKDGGSDVDTLTVTVNDLAPTAAFTWWPEPQNEGGAVSFMDASTTGPDDIVSWAWTIDGQGYSERKPTHVFADDGSYTVTLTVTDDDGSADTVSYVVTVVNVAPSVDSGADQTASEGEAIAFTGAFSDPGADTHSIVWSFGDGRFAEGTLTPTHTYADDGVYTVTLTVTDDDGGVGVDTLTVVVVNVAPVVEAGADSAAKEGASVAFSGSFTDPGADTHTYVWDFGDGSTAVGLDVSHAYGHEGVYTVTLTVTDDDGAGSDTLTVTVSNVAPTVDAGADKSAVSGDAVSFSGDFTDIGWLDTHTIVWSFGDGTTESDTLTPSHIYLAAGTYTVTLTVTDDGGATASDTAKVTVTRIQVGVDIKPGDSTPAPINLKAKGKIPVAVIGSATLDVKQIDVATVTFGPASCKPSQYSYEDVNGDGILDLVLHFETQSTGIKDTDTYAVLKAQLLDGRQIEGKDAIKIVPK